MAYTGLSWLCLRSLVPSFESAIPPFEAMAFFNMQFTNISLRMLALTGNAIWLSAPISAGGERL